MSERVRLHCRFLVYTALWFVLFSLPSLALRWWHPDPLGAFAEPKYRWMHEVLKAAPDSKIGLVGTSQIKTAVNSVRISEALEVSPDTLVNFGTARPGRDRDYLLARELIRSLPKLELLVVEVGRTESDEVHPYFHRLASLGDSFDDPLNNLETRPGFQGIRGRLEFWVVETLGNTVAGYAQLLYREAVRLRFRFEEENRFTATGGWLERNRSLDRPLDRRRARAYVPDRHRRAVQYLEGIAGLCQKEGVGLVFLEVPHYRDRLVGPEYQSFLEGLRGVVLSFPDRRELFQTRNWSDRGHLNTQGAALFSDWLAEELRQRPSPVDSADSQLIDSSLFD
jgi:hypothetical protein